MGNIPRVEEQEQAAVVGMVLGDASLVTEPNSGKAYLQFRHTIRQREYALHKADILRQITHVNVTESEGYTDARTGKKYPFINVKTRCHPLYTRLREVFYPAGHKVVDPFWLNKLDERGFAFWYLDDGCTKQHHCYLATLAFSWAENHMMAARIWERFGLHADVRKWAKGHPIIRFPAKSRQRLAELLTPYAVPAALEYKIPNVGLPRGANLSFPKAGKPKGWMPDRDGEIVRSLEQSRSYEEIT